MRLLVKEDAEHRRAYATRSTGFSFRIGTGALGRRAAASLRSIDGAAAATQGRSGAATTMTPRAVETTTRGRMPSASAY